MRNIYDSLLRLQQQLHHILGIDRQKIDFLSVVGRDHYYFHLVDCFPSDIRSKPGQPHQEEIEHDLNIYQKTSVGYKRPHKKQGSHGINLADFVRMWPTPTASESINVPREVTWKGNSPRIILIEFIDDFKRVFF